MTDRAGAAGIPKTLVVTNDFPPRLGGVQQYIFNLVANQPPERVTVLAPDWPGAQAHDAALPFRVERLPSKALWPSANLRSRVRGLLGETSADVVLLGSAVPQGLIGPELAAGGTPYVVATHGVEYWMSLMPGAASVLRRATSRASRVLALSNYTGRVIRSVVPKRVPMSLVQPGVDIERFRPDIDGRRIRERHGLSDRPVILCVSRLVRRKGQDVLLQALPGIRRRLPDAVLLIVGDGPDRKRLKELASALPVEHAVVFAGAVSDAELPEYHAAADVFAMPCRSRLGGLEVEGFGIVFMEAAASGKPVVAGDSGGAAEAVRDGETGMVVDGRNLDAVTEAITGLLLDPARAERMGMAGLARAERDFAWPALAARAAEFLRDAAFGPTGVGR